jgi:hypothetical protein
MRKGRRGRGWLLVVLAVAATAWIAYNSPTFQSCMGEPPSSPGAGPLYELAADLVAQLGLYQQCLGKFLYANGALMIALFTIILAIATSLAWQAAKALLKTVEVQMKRAEAVAAQQAHDVHAVITAARRAADAAENIFVATQRPWVKVSIDVAGPLVYDENGANVVFRFTLENIGNSPARNVWVEARLIAQGIGIADEPLSDARHIQRQLVAETKARGPSPYGFVLFPKDVAAQDIPFNIPQDELTRITQRVDFMRIQLVGTIDYCSGFRTESHQTGFVVEVGRHNGAETDIAATATSPAPIYIDEQDVAAEDLRLHRSMVHGSYAD